MPPFAPTASSLSIRTATDADIPMLRSLAERTWRISYAEMLAPAQIDYMLAWMYSPERIAQEFCEGVVWELAFRNGEPVGFLSLTIDGLEAKLNKLYVLPEHQGHGIGARLLEHIDQLATARGAREIRLQVNKRNVRARQTYERAGYAVECAAVFDIGGGYVMDDFVLRRDLRDPRRLNANPV